MKKPASGWFPKTCALPTAHGLGDTLMVAVDPGRPTGLALATWDGKVARLWTGTLPVKPGPALGYGLRLNVRAAMDEVWHSRLGQHWYTAETGQVHQRSGQARHTETGHWKGVRDNARLEGQLEAILATEFKATFAGLYTSHEWRPVVLSRGAGNLKGPIAKLLAVDWVGRHFGPRVDLDGNPCKLNDHEAEAGCLALAAIIKLAETSRRHIILPLEEKP